MVRVSLCVSALLGAVTMSWAADEPEELKPLVGKWTRAAVKADDGKTEVVPRLTIRAEGENRILSVGATYTRDGTAVSSQSVYNFTHDAGKKRSALVVELDQKKVEVVYVIEKDVLKLTCKQKLQAGAELKAYDVSGTWKRVP